MREITTHHKVNELNRQIAIHVHEHSDGTRFQYDIEAPHIPHPPGQPGAVDWCVELEFQQGMPADAGCNGLTIEVLLAIVIDKLEGFQAGAHPHICNHAAIVHLYDVLTMLKQRADEITAKGEQP